MRFARKEKCDSFSELDWSPSITDIDPFGSGSGFKRRDARRRNCRCRARRCFGRPASWRSGGGVGGRNDLVRRSKRAGSGSHGFHLLSRSRPNSGTAFVQARVSRRARFALVLEFGIESEANPADFLVVPLAGLAISASRLRPNRIAPTEASPNTGRAWVYFGPREPSSRPKGVPKGIPMRRSAKLGPEPLTRAGHGAHAF